MTVEQCYAAFGGNYAECLSRLRTDERIAKFLKKTAEDGSFDLLTQSLKDGNVQEAFRAAHTLKGVCMNLSITKLYQSASRITEALRGRETLDGADFQPLLDEVRQDYELMLKCIAQID
ncbi:MAG: Hpt domain-containing protein [Corallococcus sp.]|nr:Hpt domain-containing protein [Corallococcus sp.]